MYDSLTGWIYALSDDPDSDWGVVDDFYDRVLNHSRGPILRITSEVWGRLLRKNFRPKIGDGFAFYHTTRARFPEGDLFKNKPRISLIGKLKGIKCKRRDVTWIDVVAERRTANLLRRNPIIRDQNTEHIFENCEITSGNVASYFHADRKSWREILDLLDARITNTSTLGKKDLSKRHLSQGAGFGDKEQNKKVETAAILFVTKSYRRHGWAVDSVENERCGYDLVCRKGKKEINVEVKGINGQVPIYIMTAGEYEQAITNPKFMLCLVTNARSKNRQLFCYTGREVIDKFTFKSLQYRVELKK